MRVLDKDLVPKHLLLVMAATVQRIRDPGGPANAWADESRKLVMTEVFTKLSIGVLQTLLLLQRYEENRGAHLDAWLLSGIAIKVAHALQLNIEHDNQPTTAREIRRRIMWTCVIMDSVTDPGARPVSGIRHSELHIRLPCAESSFLRGQDSPDAPVHGTDLKSAMVAFRDSISAQLVTISILRSHVVDYTFSYHPRNIGHLPQEVPWGAETTFQHLRDRLDQWKMQLPPQFVVTSEDRVVGHDIQLLTLHCLFHGSFCDLLRLGSILVSLPAKSLPTPPTEFLDACARDLLDHSLSMAEAITQVFKSVQDGCDSFVGVCACLVLRFLIIDRRPQDHDYLPLSHYRIQTAIVGTAACARSTSRWSEPIRRYLHAIRQMCSKRGYTLFPDEGHLEHEEAGEQCAPPADSISRAPSPSLRTYGTFATVRKEIDFDDGEIPSSPRTTVVAPQSNDLPDTEQSLLTTVIATVTSDPSGGSSNSGSFPVTDPLAFTAYDTLVEEDLHTLLGWTDDTYDADATEAMWTNNMFIQDYV